MSHTRHIRYLHENDNGMLCLFPVRGGATFWLRFIKLRRLGKVVNDSNIYTRTTRLIITLISYCTGVLLSISSLYTCIINNNKLHVLRRDYCFCLRKQLRQLRYDDVMMCCTRHIDALLLVDSNYCSWFSHSLLLYCVNDSNYWVAYDDGTRLFK